MRTRTYGTLGSAVIVLHGGPGAPGYMAPVARGLAGAFRVLEPMQRRSGAEPLTVALHVEDLHQLIEKECAAERPALVGSSWGAMLALAYAAAHPDRMRGLVLIGCGTFDPEARAEFKQALEKRTGAALRKRLNRLEREIPDPDARLQAAADLVLPLYSYDLVTTDTETETCDARANRETWDDMVRLQEAGVYPAAFRTIRAPVLMLHGSVDPHPGERTRATLAHYLPQIEYLEWERCGHYPWLERAVRETFFEKLLGWLTGLEAREESA